MMKETLLTVCPPCRQRDGAKSDQCSQGELEQHGGTSVGRAGGLQSKKHENKSASAGLEDVNG